MWDATSSLFLCRILVERPSVGPFLSRSSLKMLHFGCIESVGIELGCLECFWGDLPLAHMSILLIDSLLVILASKEPGGILRLLHDDLDTSTSCMQLIVDRFQKLFCRINWRLPSATLFVSCRRLARWIATELILQGNLALIATLGPERILETLVGIEDLLVLIVFLLFLLLLLLLLLFQFSRAFGEDFVDD